MKFRIHQDRTYISDFDKEVKRLTGGKSPQMNKPIAKKPKKED